MFSKTVRVANQKYPQIAARIFNPNEERIMNQLCGPRIGMPPSDLQIVPRVVPGYASTTIAMKRGVVIGQLLACLDKSLDKVDAQLAVLVKAWEFMASHHTRKDVPNAIPRPHARYPHMRFCSLFTSNSIALLKQYYFETRDGCIFEPPDIFQYQASSDSE